MSHRTYEVVTNRITELLERGVVPWHVPWRSGVGMPRSLSTGEVYRGVNVWVLAGERRTSPWWGTRRQIAERGGAVREEEEERGIPVIFWGGSSIGPIAHDGGRAEDRTSFIFRRFIVFNAEQCEGIVVPEIPATHEEEPFGAAQAMVNGYLSGCGAPRVRDGSDGPCWLPSTDTVFIPRLMASMSAEEYYPALFHELVHSTGHASRLDRGDVLEYVCNGASYSREELVAEMGAALLCGTTGIAQVVPLATEAYRSSWIAALEADPRLAVGAAALAQRAADWIRGAGCGETVVAAAAGSARSGSTTIGGYDGHQAPRDRSLVPSSPLRLS